MNTAVEEKPKKVKPKIKAEDSVSLRVVATLVALLCISVSALYTRMNLLEYALYCWMAITGSYLSFYFRAKRIGWLSLLIGAGLLGVMAKFVFEIYLEFKIGRIEGLIPFIHVLIGLLTMQTFDLETRTDLNISVLIALGLFTCTAVIGTDLKFGFFVVMLVVLGTLMLYFESISRTRANESAPQEGVPPVVYATARPKSGVGVLPILMIPALSFLFFLFIPRVDSVFDTIVNYVHSFTGKNAPRLSYLPGGDEKIPDGKTKGKGGAGTDGFSHVSDPVGLAKAGASYGKSGTATGPDGKKQPGGAAAPGSTAAGDGTGGPGGAGGGKSGTAGAKGAGGGTQKGAGKPGDKPGTAPPGVPGQSAGDAKGGKATGQPQAEENDNLVFRDAQNAVGDDKLMLYVGSTEAVYLRRMYFDKYDGHHWTVSHHGKVANCEKLQGIYAELGGVPALHVSPKMKFKEVVQRISVMSSIGHVLPTADVPQSIGIGEEKITVDDYGVVRCKSELKEVTNYEVISKVPVYDLDALRRVSTPDSLPDFQKEFANYLQLPDDKSANSIEAEAQVVTGSDGNWFTKAERINNYLRTHYKYSTDPFVDNPDADLVSEFLFKKKKGACGEFASSFAVMCRAVGIPSRMVGGFAPGEYDSQADRREVRAKDGHSWAEIYLPEVGWIPFDPTPAGTLPLPPENVNPIVASIDRALKDMAANFSAQQMDHQLSHGRDENYPVKVDDVKVRGMQRPVKDVTQPNMELGKKTSKGNSIPVLGAPTTPPDDSEKAKGFNFDDSTQPKGTKTSPWLYVAAAAAALGLTGLGAAAYFFRSHLRRFIFKSEYPRVAKGVKPSTLVYLKLSDDLRKLKILRRPSDTAEDLGRRFFETFTEDEPCHPELPSLFDEFMELYLTDRFSTDENSVDNYRTLRDLGARIQTLARVKYVDKAS